MTDKEQKKNAKEFVERWKSRGSEKSDSQAFWDDLLHSVYGIEHPSEYIKYEEEVHIDHTAFIDGHIPETRVMIEQKGLNKRLDAPIRQSDGSLLTPFQQAQRYCWDLPVDEHPLYIITSNFAEFWVYDMNKPHSEPEIIKLENLERDYYRLNFLVKKENIHIQKEMEISVHAGQIVGKLYDALHARYVNPDSAESLHSLNVLMVRLVFCLYAENGGIFNYHTQFHDYLKKYPANQIRDALEKLFEILDTPENERNPYIKQDNPDLVAFPYVNGGLFSDKNIEIPTFNDEARSLLLDEASAGFDWSGISPTIFGAVFESTLNPETRRSGGMHYTSIENIHKVIDPLFLNDLKTEFNEIKEISVDKTRNKKLQDFQKKIANLTFLDPACGSGNFLTETYLSLRRLENEVIYELMNGQITMGDTDFSPVQVSIAQFYGIEINDFAVTVSRTALWIAEAQMIQETENIVHRDLDFLPLKTYDKHIVEGNALRIGWNDIIQSYKLNYIMGNPPFMGTKYQDEGQKEDILYIDKRLKPLDYVTGWFKKASDFIQNTNIKCAFVATNSITQGEQVAPLWECLNIKIIFAYRTFRWDNESNNKALVYCVIIGFVSQNASCNIKYIYDNNKCKIAKNINGYLIDAPNISIKARKFSICSDVQPMVYGSKPSDGGNLLLSETERKDLINAEPKTEKYIKQYMGATDLINGTKRYCLWLVDCTPNELKNMPKVLERLEKVRQFRLTSKKAITRKWADNPSLFTEIR